MYLRNCFAIGLLALMTATTFAGEPEPDRSGLRFEVSVAKGLLPEPRDGRLFVVLGRPDDKAEPRLSIGQTEKNAPPVFGVDADKLSDGGKVFVDQRAAAFPIANLAKLPPGKYRVQAVFHHHRDLNLPDAPGNLYSEPINRTLDPTKEANVSLLLSRKIPEERLPDDTAHVKFLKIRSELLGKFHGRPIYFRIAVILPRDFAKENERRYPLVVHIGGYGTRYTAAGDLLQEDNPFHKMWLADQTPRMLLLHLDGAGPFGDPYQVNSANNGPFGDALTQEIIPLVEKKFRGIGQPYARVLEGHSTGGWVSLALQVFYPDFFNGCWSHAPDPVDFRAYETVNIYENDNAYVDATGIERPASRNLAGKVLTTIRGECQMESVLGRGNRWELSGKDWCAWNAVFGPRGDDGLPRPIWNGKTGKIDRSVIEHWKKYDLRRAMEENWQTLGPKLQGKIRIWVGEADDYYLNRAVHLLDDFLSKAQPLYEGRIVYGKGAGHSWRGISDAEMFRQMAEAIAKGRKKKS